ncbi:MAG: stalk domain-containing protein [Cellulosilyticaceae bacterium]
MDPKNMVKYLEIMKDTLGIDLTAFVGEIEETDVAQMQESIDLIKELLVQSKVIVKYTITDKEFKQDVQMDFVLGEGMNMSMDLVSTSKKVAPKEVKIPEKRVDLSMEEYMGLMTPSGVLVDLTTGQIMNMAQGMTQEVKIIKVIKEAEEIYVPFKAVVTALGYEMDYNEKTKEVILVQDGKDVVVKVVLKDNTSYISVTELQNQGFNVTVEGTSLIILD